MFTLRAVAVASALALSLAAGCATPPTAADGAGSIDMAHARGSDLAGQPDLATQETPDMASALADMTESPDLTPPPDLVALADLTPLPDLMPLPDLARLPDLAQQPLPDLSMMMLPVDMAMAMPTDLSMMAPLDMVAADLALPPDMQSPTILLAPAASYALGVTSDGLVVYAAYDAVNKTYDIDAVPVAGGQPIAIFPRAVNPAVGISGKVAFVWDNLDANGNSPLSVWTQAGGAVGIANSSSSTFAFASTDGRRVIFTDNANAAAKTIDIRRANSDASALMTLYTGVNNDPAVCTPVALFSGTHFVIGQCAAGQSAATISSFDAAWIKADLLANARQSAVTDTAGTKVLVASTGNVGQVVPIGGGNPTLIANNFSAGLLTGDGSTVVYNTTMGALYRTAVANPVPFLLVATGVNGIYNMSPDEKYLLYSTTHNNMTGLGDLYLSSTTMANNVATISAVQTAGLYADYYTADSSHVLFGTNINATTAIGTLSARAVAMGPAVVEATKSIGSFSYLGSKILYTDNTMLNANNVAVRTDLKAVDTAGGMSKAIASQVDLNIFLTPAHDQVVYSVNVAMGLSNGLFVTTLP